MAQLEILGRAFELAPLKLGDLRKVAPHIDQINQTAGALTTLGGLSEATRSMIEILAVALARIDEEITADAIEDACDLADIPKIQTAIKDLLEASGLAPKGEVTAPSAPAPKGRGSRSK